MNNARARGGNAGLRDREKGEGGREKVFRRLGSWQYLFMIVIVIVMAYSARESARSAYSAAP